MKALSKVRIFINIEKDLVLQLFKNHNTELK